ncbi:invertase/pectin methylesterase inhibitor family protein [Striga asiatica]|uniref:Invertase/pectin methylesterase inhibitor family protein n=1 Tax=Striga asiatica TaxID=4170 RepID=A0A5A7QRA1_STRAF|nr:invertase/pectin methylesterase inhibitor family protein [Striga asiatica]
MGSYFPLLIITHATILFLFPSSPPITTAASGKQNPATQTCHDNPLVTSVCENVNKTTGFDFCCATFFNDTVTPTDIIDLSYIAFRKTYAKANDILNQILPIITYKRNKKELNAMRKCSGDYNRTKWALATVLEDLDSETYEEFNVLALSAQGNVSSCDKRLNRASSSSSSVVFRQIRNESGVIVKLTDICYRVALLFQYSK